MIFEMKGTFKYHSYERFERIALGLSNKLLAIELENLDPEWENIENHLEKLKPELTKSLHANIMEVP
jgi:hypothetical protein